MRRHTKFEKNIKTFFRNYFVNTKLSGRSFEKFCGLLRISKLWIKKVFEYLKNVLLWNGWVFCPPPLEFTRWQTWLNYHITIARVFAKFSAQADWQTRLRCDLLDSTQPAPHCKMSHHDNETACVQKNNFEWVMVFSAEDTKTKVCLTILYDLQK